VALTGRPHIRNTNLNLSREKAKAVRQTIRAINVSNAFPELIRIDQS